VVEVLEARQVPTAFGGPPLAVHATGVTGTCTGATGGT
jgi:hypothetical protein